LVKSDVVIRELAKVGVDRRDSAVSVAGAIDRVWFVRIDHNRRERVKLLKRLRAVRQAVSWIVRQFRKHPPERFYDRDGSCFGKNGWTIDGARIAMTYTPHARALSALVPTARRAPKGGRGALVDRLKGERPAGRRAAAANTPEAATFVTMCLSDSALQTTRIRYFLHVSAKREERSVTQVTARW
jgi:hypothetical protein